MSFKISKLIMGYDYADRYTKTELSVSGLLDNVQFNTVEGLNIGVVTQFVKRYQDRRSWRTELGTRAWFCN